MSASARVLELVESRPPTLGQGRLVCVDGPAGSGKSTLAAAIGAARPDATVLHTDDLLQGWGGLTGLSATVQALLRPLASGRPASWRRWDWVADDWAETHTVSPGGLLVLEGTGSWHPDHAALVGVLAWVEVEPSLRLARGLERDGEAMRAHWLRWQREEYALHAELATREHADLVIDGTE